jgi:hypothetical protein
VKPCCQFCHDDILDVHLHILEPHGWYHELCWWKAECARLTAIIAELKEEGPADSLSHSRHARHSLGSEPTTFNEDGEVSE